MRTYKISDSHSLSNKNISNIIEDNFGEISSEDNDTYIIENPRNKTVEEIYISINYKEKEILLDISEKDVSELQSKNLLSNVPDIVISKNRFLEQVTGRTVEDRKQNWRQDVLPTNEDVIRYDV